MKPRLPRSRDLALISAFAFTAIAGAANLTWDTVAGDGATVTTGSGTWNTAAIAWNNAGADVAWTQTNTTTATNNAIFGGADGTYAITVGAAVAANNITFNNSGYTLSATSAQTITLNAASPAITLATGKSAVLGGNVTISTTPASGNPLSIAGAGTLDLSGTGAKIQTGSNNISLTTGPIVNVATGTSLISAAQFVVGTTTTSTQLNVNGGTVSLTSTGTANLVLANSTTGTVAANLKLSSTGGTVTNASPTGGLRIGPGTGGVSTVSGTVDLDGGVLTVGKIYEGTGGATISTVNFNGGTLKALATTTFAGTFLTGLDFANVKSGGAKIDSNGVDITISQALLDGGGSGGLTKEGNGTLTLTGANTYTGGTTINGGKLAIAAPYSAVTATTINANARLRVTTASTASSIPSITVNTDGGIETNVGTYTVGQLAGLSTTTFNAAGNYKIDLTGLAVPVGDITVLTYTSKTGAGLPSLGSVPPGVTGTVEDTGSAIVIHVITPQVPAYTWSAGTGSWDTTTANWTGSLYTEGSVVTFPEIAGDNTVTLTADRSPFSVTVSNATTSTYAFAGSAIAGSATVSKSGSGVATLGAANSYSGLTNISSGVLLVGTNNALGATTGGTSVTSGAAVGLAGGITYSSTEPVTGSGVGNTAVLGALAVQRGFVQGSSGNNTFAGPIQINATGVTRIGVQDAAQLTLSGAITPATGVTGIIMLFRAGLNDGDYITLSNSNSSWDGETRIFTTNIGTGAGLRLGIDNGLPATTSVVAGGGSSASGNTFDLNGHNQTLNGLTFSNGTLHIRNNAAATTSVLTLSPAAAANNFGTGNVTTIEDGDGVVALVKAGTFSQNLEGVHTYSGSTTINGGKLSLGPAATIDNTASMLIAAGASFDVSAKASYAIPSGKPVTLKIDGTAAGSAGRIKAAGLDISNATVVLDPVNALDDAVYILADYTAGSLLGTQFLAVNAIPGYTLDYGYNAGTQIALVQNSSSGFASWISGFSVGGLNQPGDDADSDGIANLLEFVLNGNPSESDPSILPALAVTTTDFEFTFHRRDDSLSPETSQIFQYGTDLSTWTDVVVPAAGGTVGAATITVTGGSPADIVTIRIPKTAVSPSNRLFGRLQILKP